MIWWTKDSKSISKDEAINNYNDIAEKGEKIAKLRQRKNRQKFLEIINSLEKVFDELKVDDKQTDTADIPDLESEESAAQRRNEQGKGFNISTPNQMLSKLPILLAQLKAGNNSKELNEIRQLLYSLYT